MAYGLTPMASFLEKKFRRTHPKHAILDPVAETKREEHLIEIVAHPPGAMRKDFVFRTIDPDREAEVSFHPR